MWCDHCHMEVSAIKNPAQGTAFCPQCGTEKKLSVSNNATIAQTAHALLKRWEETRPALAPAEEETVLTDKVGSGIAASESSEDMTGLTLPLKTAKGKAAKPTPETPAPEVSAPKAVAPEKSSEKLFGKPAGNKLDVAATSATTIKKNPVLPPLTPEEEAEAELELSTLITDVNSLAQKALSREFDDEDDFQDEFAAPPQLSWERSVPQNEMSGSSLSKNTPENRSKKTDESQRSPSAADSGKIKNFAPKTAKETAAASSLSGRTVLDNPQETYSLADYQPSASLKSAEQELKQKFAQMSKQVAEEEAAELKLKTADKIPSQGISVGSISESASSVPRKASTTAATAPVMPSATVPEPAPTRLSAEQPASEPKKNSRKSSQGQVRFSPPSEKLEEFDIQQAIERHQRKQRNWSALIGQFLAFCGALAMTGGGAIVIGNHFGSLEIDVTQGWLVIVGGHLLFILGLYTHLTSRAEQTWTDLHNRCDELTRIVLQQQQTQKVLLQNFDRETRSASSTALPASAANASIQRHDLATAARNESLQEIV